MSVIGCKLPLFVLLLSVVIVQVVYCKHEHHWNNQGHHGHNVHHGKHEYYEHNKESQHHVEYKNFPTELDTYQPIDYYIISQVLAFYIAYATKHLDYKVDENCPVAIVARETFVHKEGPYVFLWKKSTGTIQAILTCEGVELWVSVLANYDVPEIFDELVGANGKQLTAQTLAFTEITRSLIEQLDGRKFLTNFNGPVIYYDLFLKHNIYINPETSPLCELVNVKTPKEFIEAIEYNSLIVKFLRNISNDPAVGLNEPNYVFPNDHECWNYIFGSYNIIEVLPAEIQCLFNEAGLSKFTGNLNVEDLSLYSLHVEGIYPYLKEWLFKIWYESH